MGRTEPTRIVAQLSDVHLRPAVDPLVGGVVDASARLARALEVLSGWDVACDAWLFTGDLSDTGSSDTYAALREAVEPAAAERGVHVLWGNGNHDDRGALAAAVLGGDDGRPVNRAYDLDGLRVLTLDTCVPGLTGGEVSAEALSWLADELSRPAPLGTLLAVHHAPIPVVQDAAARWELADSAALGAVVAGTDVRLIVGGHFHQSTFTTLAGVPVACAPSLAYTQDVTAGRTLRGQDAHAGFHLLEFHPDRVAVTAVHLDTGASVHQAIGPDR